MSAAGRWLRLTRLEVARVSLSRRWLLAVAACLGVATLAGGTVAVESQNAGLAPAAWDVHAAGLNSLMYVGYLLLPCFAFVVGDSIVHDRETTYGFLTLGRGATRDGWWLAKVVAIGWAAFVLQAMFLVCCLAVGALWHGWPAATAASTLATAPASAHSMVLFPTVPAGADMLTRELTRGAYLACAFWAIGAAMVAITVRYPLAYLPILIALLGTIADYVLLKAVGPWSSVSPAYRLLEGVHGAAPAASGVSWTSSIAYYATLGALAIVAGAWLMRRCDV